MNLVQANMARGPTDHQLSYRGQNRDRAMGSIVAVAGTNQRGGKHSAGTAKREQDQGSATAMYLEQEEDLNDQQQQFEQQEYNYSQSIQSTIINQDGQVPKHGQRIQTTSNKIFNPGHHKANSMQISSKYKAQQLLQQKRIQHNAQHANITQSQNNFVSFKNKPNEPNTTHHKQQKSMQIQQQPPQNVIQFHQADSIQILDDSQIMNMPSGTATPAEHTIQMVGGGKNNSKKMTVLKNAAQQQIQMHQIPINQGTQGQKAHILMNQQQHVRVKQQSQMPNDIQKMMGDQVMASQGGQMQPSHKKSNSIQNQRMMQLLMNKDNQQNSQFNQIIGNQPQILKSQQFNEGASKGFVQGGTQGQQMKINSQSFHNNQIPQSHHGKSKSFMQSELMSIKEDQQAKAPATMKQTKGIKAGLANEQHIVMNNIIKNQPHKPKTSKQNLNEQRQFVDKQIYADKLKGKQNTAIMPSMLKSKGISNSFDKTNSGANQVVQHIQAQQTGFKQQTFHNNPKLGVNSINLMGGILKGKKQSTDHGNLVSNTHGVPTTGIITQGMITQCNASGIQSIVTSSQTELESINKEAATKQQTIIQGHHRNKSDANYIQTLQNNNKNNFVISSSNHVYQSKKASNLKSMSSNSNHQVSSQGATKGLLNKLNQNAVAQSQHGAPAITGPGGRAGGQAGGGHHKKNQYSTIVKSNYKNLVEGGDFSELDNQNINKEIDIEVFNSNQNKTTEQKYAELKMKYNDLLNKHLYLAAQKTEDNRKIGPKSNMQGHYQKGANVRHQANIPIHNAILVEPPQYQQQFPQTQQQTLDNSQMRLTGDNVKLYGGSSGLGIIDQNFVMHSQDQIKQQNLRYQQHDSQNFDGQIAIMIEDQDCENDASQQENDFNMIIGSQNVSQNQTPREIIGQTVEHRGHQNIIINPVYDNQGRQSSSQNISSTNINGRSTNNNIYDLQENVVVQNESNSRMEAQAPIVGNVVHFSQNIVGKKGKNTIGGASHKRSVSDGIFNNVVKAKNGQSNSIDNNPEPVANIQTYHQQIPLKSNQRQGTGDFEDKIRKLRAQNDLGSSHCIQQLAPQNTDVEILGDTEQIIEEQLESQSLQDENLVTDVGQEHDKFNVYNDMGNQDHANQIYYQNENSGKNSQKFHMMAQGAPKSAYSNTIRDQKVTNNTMQSDVSGEIVGVQVTKNKRKKPTVNMRAAGQIPEIDMNKLAKKYKQMRKSGEYTAGLSGDTAHNSKKASGQIEAIKASGLISDRFGPQDVMKQKQPLIDGGVKTGHRRVKSGTSDQTANQHMINKPIMYQQQRINQPTEVNSKAQIANPVLPSNSNIPSSNQRSLNSLKYKEQQLSQARQYSQKIKKGIKGLPASEVSKRENKNNYMLIAEDNIFGEGADPSSFANQFPDQHNKVINVSFNDFNQSISNDCNDIELEDSSHINENLPSGNSALQQIARNSSNKNLNNFLEVLQKIKPQQSQQTNQQMHAQQNNQQANSPKIMNQGSKIKKPNKSEIPGGFTEQSRLQKYQKMMSKVKKHDVQIKKQPNVGVGHHQRIKSTNDGFVASSGGIFAGMNQKYGDNKKKNSNNQMQIGQYTPQAPIGTGHSTNKIETQKVDNEEGESQNLKITFIGDEALLKQHQQLKNHPGKKSVKIQPQYTKQIQFHQNPISASGSNTGGQPSPIISTKRVPQKILGKEQNMSPTRSKNTKVKQNNFLMISNEEVKKQAVAQKKKPSLSRKGKIMFDHQDVQMVSDLDSSSLNFSPIDSQSKHHQLIQNLNKGNFILQQSPQNLILIPPTPLSNLTDSQSEHMHIIKHPITSKASSKVTDFNQIGVESGFNSAAAMQPLNPPQAPQVSERLVTEESNRPSNAAGGIGGDTTPRSKQIRKLVKQIKLSFRLRNIAPQTTIDFYRIGKILGKGAFGKVNLAVHKVTECLCAVKSINKQYFSDPSQSKKVMQEVVMLKKTRHQNIVRLYEYFETEKHIVFVIELCAGGDLLNYVRRRRRLKEDVAKCLFKQIIESLAYCHKKNILHRDIKLDNILLDANGQVKICDFGVGKIVKKGEKMTEQCGTPAYIAPEILRDKGYYGFAVDIWSAGVVLYAMLYGTVPFKAGNMTELQKLIMKAKYTLKEDTSQEARDLLKGLMEKDPEKRMTISQILKHQWLEDAKESHMVELFTEQEKQYIKSEYSYNRSKRYNRNFEMTGGLNGTNVVQSNPLGELNTQGDLDKDMFTEHQLDSIQNSILKNCETKSVILAPFNSTKSNLQMDENGQCPTIELSDSIKELIEDRKIIKFGARVRDIDRQYEINNNADLDNGVYHKFDEDEENKDEQQNDGESSKSSESEEKEEEREEGEEPLDEEEQEILKQLKKQGKQKGQPKKKNKQSELQKLEDMIHDQEEKDMNEVEHFMMPDDEIGHDAGGGNLVTENSQQQSVNRDSADILQSDNFYTPQNPNGQIKVPDGGNPVTEESVYSPMQPADNHMRELFQKQLLGEQIMVEESIVAQVEEFGYPKEFILKGLSTHDLNYATTAYLLLHFQRRKGAVKNDQLRMNIIENNAESNVNTQNTERSRLSGSKGNLAHQYYRENKEKSSSNINTNQSIPDMN